MGWRLRRTRLSSRNASMRERPRRDKQKKHAQLFHAINPQTSLTEPRSKKTGSPFRLPVGVVGCPLSLLERESQPKCEQPHRRVIFNVGNSPGVPTAIDTSIALGVVETHYRVVEDVVGIHAELRRVTLGDAEVLREREIRREEMRSAERVVPDVSECTRCRTGEHAAG